MRREKGFTLVELMVVITILGILVALAVANVGPINQRAKETQVMAGAKEIVTALETFASNNGGNYPGVALPRCDDDGISPFLDEDGDIDLYTMRALIGGGKVDHDPAVSNFLDGFYFPPQPVSVIEGQEQIPDRLRNSAAIELYPINPFRKNVAGLTNKGIPMINIWGIEFQDVIEDPVDVWNNLGFHLSYPLYFDDADPGEYNFPDPWDYGGVADFDPWYLGDWRGTVWGANYEIDPMDPDYMVTEGELQQWFPEGDFAYIPLDPVQTDPTNEQFMRYCKNYWLVVYGSKRTFLKNKFQEVDPQFPHPLGDGDPNFSNTFELTVKAALTGAMEVYPTAYKEQLNVAGID
jgi:prepilin-type N-terminal cleavage/methylation domain-containing protein